LIEEIDDLLAEMYGRPVWKPDLPPLDELVLTILSQNTAAANYRRAFASLRERFPDWEDVLRAPVTEVAEAIRCGGLADMKAGRVQALLSEILAQRGELSLDLLADLPAATAYEYLQRFEGVGPKTAACVLMFSLGLPVFPVDTHIARISKRLGLAEAPMGAEKIQAMLQERIPPNRVYSFHVNLVKHGRTLCKARRTFCDQCLLHVCPSRGVLGV